MGYWKKLWSWGLSYCAMSCALSAITLPIISAAGIPLPLLAPLGTLIFTPLVTLILASSGILFIAHLLGLPGTGILIALIELCTALWQQLLDLAPAGYCIPFPALPLSAVAPLVALQAALIYGVRHKHPALRIVFYIFSMCMLYTAGYVLLPYSRTVNLVRSGNVRLVRSDQFITLIDEGRCIIKNPLGWADYTVARALTTEGRLAADLLLIKRATAGSLYRAELLAEKKLIRAIIIDDPGTDTRKAEAFAQKIAHQIPCIINERDNR